MLTNQPPLYPSQYKPEHDRLMKEREQSLRDFQKDNMTQMMQDVKLDRKIPWEGPGKDLRGDSWDEDKEEEGGDDEDEDSGEDIDRSTLLPRFFLLVLDLQCWNDLPSSSIQEKKTVPLHRSARVY